MIDGSISLAVVPRLHRVCRQESAVVDEGGGSPDHLEDLFPNQHVASRKEASGQGALSEAAETVAELFRRVNHGKEQQRSKNIKVYQNKSLIRLKHDLFV